MSIKPAARAMLCAASIVLAGGAGLLAHEIVGVQSYSACAAGQARAFLRSPNPGTGNRDFPLVVRDEGSDPTGEHIVVMTLQNSSTFDARVTAVGFAWAGEVGGFELVQLSQSYNDLTTNDAGVRTGSAHPGDFAVVPAIAIAQAHGDVTFSVRQGVHGVPDFPNTILSFALVTGNTFSGGQPEDGLATDTSRHQIAVKGVLPTGGGPLDIEELLNDVYVRFRRVGQSGEGSETGIWRNLLPIIACQPTD